MRAVRAGLVAVWVLAGCDGGGAASDDAARTPIADAARGGDAETPPADAAAPDAGRVDADPADGSSDAAPPTTPFSLQVLDDVRISSDGGDPNFQNARGDFDLGPGPFARVTMVVELDTTCFPFERWRDEPPPAGHRWPPSCDAFDRNFEVTVDWPEAEGEPPAFELMRAITPFGGPARHEIDVTDFANARPGQHRANVHITTWSDGAGQVSGAAGGWNVSLRFDVEPGPAPRRVLAAIPLLNEGYGRGAGVRGQRFTTPPGTTSTRLEYRVTGHGGGPADADCIGHADEFCRRRHTLHVDRVPTEALVPWREDCATLCTLTQAPPDFGNFQYCAENPTGAVQSVQAPRANWCPGALTPPFTWDFEPFRVPGRHDFDYEIRGVAEGGVWRVSAVFYAFGD